MTTAQKIQDYRDRAQNPSLPQSAKNKLLEMANELEAKQGTKDLLYRDKVKPKAKKAPKAKAEKPKREPKPKAKAEKPKREPKPKAKAEKPKREPKPQAKKAPKPKPASTGPAVDRTSPATKFIKQFLALANRSVPTDRVVNYLKRLQRAILAQEIRKASKYSDLVAWIQASLVQTLQTYSRASISLELKGADMAKFQDFAADAKAGYQSAKLLKTYLGSQNAYVDGPKLASLEKRMQTALNDGSIGPGDPFRAQVERALAKLNRQSPNARFSFSEADLKGLGALSGN
jgi:hypothetical protein